MKRVEIINKQELEFIGNLNFQELIKDKSLLSDIAVERLSRVELPLSKVEDDLNLYVKIVELPSGQKRLLYFTVVNLESGVLQKVSIVTAKCSVCSWHGFIGNPMVSDLYFDIKSKSDLKEVLVTARGINRKPCPKCGTNFPQPAIWSGELLPHKIELYSMNQPIDIKIKHNEIKERIEYLGGLIDDCTSFEEEILHIKEIKQLKETRLEQCPIVYLSGEINKTGKLLDNFTIDNECSVKLLRLLRKKDGLIMTRGIPAYTHGILLRDRQEVIQASYSIDIVRNMLAKNAEIVPASPALFDFLKTIVQQPRFCDFGD